MESLEFNNIRELETRELKGIDGGYMQYVVGALTYFAVETATNYRSSYNSFMRGWNDA